jgi:transposase
VQLSMEDGRSAVEVAKELGINKATLHRWRKEYLEDAEEAFPGQGQLKESDQELAQLRREVVQLREDREILKKALVFFSKESK